MGKKAEAAWVQSASYFILCVKLCVCLHAQRFCVHPCLYSVSSVGLLRSIRLSCLLLSAVGNVLLGVSVVLYITVSNTDKVAQKLC